MILEKFKVRILKRQARILENRQYNGQSTVRILRTVSRLAVDRGDPKVAKALRCFSEIHDTESVGSFTIFGHVQRPP